ncbi:MAG: phosphoserine phosphatase SerB [Pseudomonadales bacterium]|nr:phosphoserine phosphatase SerB [Pseudomonadales bacterium]MDP6469546.1 phosphoserine phosphatase SerB [Pseudomonadales bacterium]MDP6827387.1 phosphoserine phosphatase SerB [Pseudomonadales bacterium]MDP6971210.1 phosphoserine phosphatase SerB [Pseudomonadales bacterium]
MADIVLVNVSGQDKPGLMAMLTSTLADYQARVLDLGQAVIHDELALGLLVLLPQGTDLERFQKEVLQQAGAIGSTVRFSSVDPNRYGQWVQRADRTSYVITLLCRGSVSPQLHAVSALTHRHGLNIEHVRRLSGPVQLNEDPDESKVCMEIRVGGELKDARVLQADLMEAAGSLYFDFSVHEDNVFRRNRRLVAFDMDSTLIDVEVMDELAVRFGVGEQVSAVTKRAMRGEIDFKESFRARARMLAGMPMSVLHEVTDAVRLNEGADKLLAALHHFGYRTAVISGGFQYVGERLREQLGINYVYANELKAEGDHLTGEVVGEIIDAQRKAELLREIAKRESIALQQTIAIGDGANDLPMLASAGLGVAYHAKPVVRESAGHAISNFGLDSVLYLMGFTDTDIDQALA